MHSCDQCGTTFTRKSSLLRHKNDRCRVSVRRQQADAGLERSSSSTLMPQPFCTSVKRPIDTEGSEKVNNAKRNPKMQALLDAIVNDGIPTNTQQNVYEPMLKKKKIETTPSFVKETRNRKTSTFDLFSSTERLSRRR